MYLYVCIVLFTALAWSQHARHYPPPRTVPAMIYVSQTAGDDQRSCEQATQPGTPKRSINGGLSCVPPGGVVDIAAGTYNELLSGQFNPGQTTCQSDLAAIQQPCAPMPAGLSQTQPTTLKGVKGTIVSPQGRMFPGGGGILTLGAASQYLVFEGLTLLTHTAPGSGAGVLFGDAQYVLFTRGEVDNTLSSSAGSRFLRITHNDIHHAGLGCDNQTQRTPPCPHGVYVRGQDIAIEDNLVRFNADYGIQASSEGGGIARVSIQRNQVYGNAGTAIRIACQSCTVAANLLYKNGVGITYSGSGNLIANNTIISFKEPSNDPWGIWGPQGAATIVNNLLFQQKSAWYAIGTADFSPPVPEGTHHNMSEWPAGENPGIPLSAPMEQVFANPASNDYTLKAGSPAIGAGVAVSRVPFDLSGHPYANPPSLGAYSAQATVPPDPEPPQPEPVPPGTFSLACTGALKNAGVIQMTCLPQMTPPTRR